MSRLTEILGSSIIKKTGIILAIIYCILMCFSTVSRVIPVRDDNMYISSAVLLDKYTLYEDFAYLQTPYMPYIYNAMFRVFDYDRPLLIGKIFKFILAMGILQLTYILMKKLSGSRGISLAFILILVNNQIFQFNILFVRNYDLPLLLTLAAFAFLLSGRRSPLWSVKKAIATGVLCGLCIGIKLTYLPLPLVFLVSMLHNDGISKKVLLNFSIFLFSMIIVLIPAAVIVFRAGVDTAYYNNLGFHLLNAEWFRELAGGEVIATDAAITSSEKIEYFLFVLFRDFSNALLMFPLLFGTVLYAKRLGLLLRNKTAHLPMFLTLLFIGLLMFFMATPSWHWYLYLVISSAIILASIMYGGMPDDLKTVMSRIIWTIAIVLICSHIEADLKILGNAFKPSKWATTQLHNDMTELQNLLPDSNRTLPVATVHTALALEVGMDIYPELACGDFTCRTTGMLTAEQRREYSILDPTEFDSLFAAEPPCAILINEQPCGWEIPLERYAVENNFEKYRWMDGYKFYTPN